MMNRLSTLVLASVLGAAGCAAQADIENVPVGSDVEIVREDGGVVRGKLLDRDDKTVKLDVGSASRSTPRAEITELRVVNKATPLPAIAKFREFTLPEGTHLVVRLDS